MMSSFSGSSAFGDSLDGAGALEPALGCEADGLLSASLLPPPHPAITAAKSEKIASIVLNRFHCDGLFMKHEASLDLLYRKTGRRCARICCSRDPSEGGV